MALMDRELFRGASAAGATRPALLLAATLVLFAGAVFIAGKTFAQADLDALIKAAKAEGQVLLYSSPTENVPRRVGFNDDPGGTTVYDSSGLPKQYEPPREGAPGAQSATSRRGRADQVAGLLILRARQLTH